MIRQNTMPVVRTHQHFRIEILFDGEKIPMVIKKINVNCFAVWMNDRYKFSVAAGLDEFDRMQWYVIEKNKYVPYVDQIGEKIEYYLD